MAEVAVFTSTVWLLQLKDLEWTVIFADLEMLRNYGTVSSLCGNQVHTKLASNEWEWGGPAIFKTCANAYVRSAYSSRVFLAELTYGFRL